LTGRRVIALLARKRLFPYNMRLMYKRLMQSKKLRARTSWIVALILTPPFIIAFQSFLTPPSEKDPVYNAGSIFGEPVTRETFDLHYLALRRNLENRLADQNEDFALLPPAFNSLIQQQTWNRLLLLHEAKRRGMRVSDEELAAVIRATPAFQANGRFAPDRYVQVIRSIGMDTRTYEDFLRDEMRLSLLMESVRNEVAVADESLWEAYRLANERLRTWVLVSNSDDFRETVRTELTDEAIQEAYDSRPQLVRTPETVTFKWIGTPIAELSESLEIPEEDIRIFYESNYGAPPAEPAFKGEREILSENAVTADLAKPENPPLEAVRDEIIETIRPRYVRRALNLLAMDLEDGLSEGKPLDELAESLELKTNVVGPVPRGGSAPDLPDPGLLNAAFALKAGEISDLIEQEDGVYLIETTAKEAASVPPLESVKDQIAQVLEDEGSQEAAREQLESRRAAMIEALEGGSSVEEALEALGTAAIEPEPFTRMEILVGIGLPSAATQAAFEAPIGRPTDVIRTSKGHALLIPREVLEPDEEGFAEQEAALREQVLSNKQDAHFSQWLSDLREEADIQIYSQDEQQPNP